MKRFQKLLAICLFACLLLNVTSCTSGGESSSGGSTAENSTASSSSEAASSTSSDTSTYLTDDKKALTYYVSFSGNTLINSLDDSLLYQRLEELTNVHIEFETPSGDAGQAFQLRITSDDLPDIFENFTGSYVGGPQGLIDDGIAIRLNELIDEYAPDYKAYREGNDTFRKDSILDSGDIVAFYMYAVDEETETRLEDPWDGYYVRSDWLEACNLEVPTTIDELTNVLRAFKETYNASAPLTWYIDGKDSYAYFLGAWNVGPGFFQQDGTVNYGPLTDEYKAYITQMKSWYDEGLLDAEYLTRDEAGVDVLLADNQTGVFNYSEVPEIVAVQEPIPFPTLEKGGTRFLGMEQSISRAGLYSAFVSTSCEDPELAVKWLNFGYTDLGKVVYNYGVEGTTYVLDDNSEPEWTDFVIVDGLEDDKWWAYCNGMYSRINGPFVKWFDAIPSYHIESNPARENGTVWAEGIDYSAQMPVVSLSTEDNQRVSAIMADIDTYVAESRNQFIMGLRPMEEYDAFVQQIRDYGIEEAISLYQTALDSWNVR